MKRILITGGGESMGRELSIVLADLDYEVFAYDIPVANFTGLESHGIRIIKGDITDPESIREAVRGMDVVVHLDELLPPISEKRWDTTYTVNVLGTKHLVDAIAQQEGKTRLIFSSTVATYGDTTTLEPPITSETPQHPNSNYSRSKMEAEQHILKSGIPYTILRVSGVFLVALKAPSSWPFTEEERVEFVYRGDVVSALTAAVENDETTNRTLIIAGGPTWQMLGSQFAKEFLEALNTPIGYVEYADKPLYSDWYDTKEAQRLLHYQNTSFTQFIELLRKEMDVALHG